jgi:hypothetical protein
VALERRVNAILRDIAEQRRWAERSGESEAMAALVGYRDHDAVLAYFEQRLMPPPPSIRRDATRARGTRLVHPSADQPGTAMAEITGIPHDARKYARTIKETWER